MAESILISLSSKILSSIASPVFKKAYEKGVSIWEARDDLVKLQLTIGTLQSVIVDAERKQEDSDAVKNWIMRLKGVLYDAEDLFDEVAADDLLEEFIVEGCLEKQVWVFCSKLNPVVSRYSIAKRVKVIRERLDDISTIMAQLNFVQNQPIWITMKEKSVARGSIDAKSVIGRDEDKKFIMNFVFNESSDILEVIAIEGIGGMGKTTLAHMIYNDEKLSAIFEKRWLSCISNTTDEREVLGNIYQSISGRGYIDLTMFQLEYKIKELITGKKYLLILDDVWDDHHGRWETRKSLLRSGAKGSKIIVTTRLRSVGIAMGAVRAHNLRGLSEDDSWNLFKSLAFVSTYENDPRREILGRELLKKCRGLPLSIWCMGSLLHNKTIREWEEIEKVDLTALRGNYNDETMSILKLSYYHLPSNLKQCFTYCCLFPKDYRYSKKELIYHWIAQGYINLDEGEFSFMHLLRMGFFQEVKEDEYGEIESCKMHDIMHDLALHLSGEESIIQSNKSLIVSSGARYVSLLVGQKMGGLWDIPTLLLDIKSIRSCILRKLSYQCSMPNADQLCSNFKLLRTLTLSDLSIEHIPPSVGELKLVRYLDLSRNNFEELPNSITNLVNLLVLDISWCKKLKVWPDNFKKLIKLWSLNFLGCKELTFMPEGIEGIAHLQYLSGFMVGKESELDVLNGFLKQLRDHLEITFCNEMEIEEGLNWQLPIDVSLKSLYILSYPGQSIRGWGNNSCARNLEHLELRNCKNVKYLPHLSCLTILKHLKLESLCELEFIEEEKEVNTYNNATSSELLFPCLEVLVLKDLPKLKGWRGKVAAEATSITTFPLTFADLRLLEICGCSILEKLHLVSPHIQHIVIEKCECLMSIELVGTPEPSLRSLRISHCKQLQWLHIEEHLIAELKEMEVNNCPELRLKLSKTQGKRLSVQQGLPKVERCVLQLNEVDNVLVEQSLLSLSSLQHITISKGKGAVSLLGVTLTSLRKCTIILTDGIKNLHIPSPHLQRVCIRYCSGLASVEVEAPTTFDIIFYGGLKNLRIAHPNALKELRIASFSFPTGVDWDSIPNLSEFSCISNLHLEGVDGMFIKRLLSSASPSLHDISIFKSIGSLTVALESLEMFFIKNVPGLKILNIKSPHLRSIDIHDCSQLTNVHIVHPTALIDFKLAGCPELRLSTGMNWDALTNLEYLTIDSLRSVEELPQCIRQRQALGNLSIRKIGEFRRTRSCLNFEWGPDWP